METLDSFTRSYILAMLWTSDDNAPSGDYETSGRFEELFPKIHPATLEKMKLDCTTFLGRLGGDLCGMTEDRAGHCFALSRNGHGSGFFDEDTLEEPLRPVLQNAAAAFGGCDIYFDDDGSIHHY